MSRTDDYSARPTWVALFTLPLVSLGERFAFMELAFSARGAFGASGKAGADILQTGQWSEFAGAVIAGLVCLAVGPHLTTGMGLVIALAAGGWMLMDPNQWAFWIAMAGHGAAMVSLLGAIGASGTGGVPALRYAGVFGMYAMWNVAIMLVPQLRGSIPWIGPALGAVGLLILAIPTVSWWAMKKHPRPPEEGASFRVAGASVLLFILVMTAQAVWALLEPIRGPVAPETTRDLIHTMCNPVTVISLSLLIVPVLIAMHFLKWHGRVGAMSGVGALLMSCAAVAAWSLGEAVPAIPILIILAVGEVLIYPWAFGRMVSDGHWRLTSALAILTIIPGLVVNQPETLTAVGAAMILVLLAVPIGALGWFADEWIFGDELGPEGPSFGTSGGAPRRS